MLPEECENAAGGGDDKSRAPEVPQTMGHEKSQRMAQIEEGGVLSSSQRFQSWVRANEGGIRWGRKGGRERLRQPRFSAFRVLSATVLCLLFSANVQSTADARGNS
jgi:hypothetical protein